MPQFGPLPTKEVMKRHVNKIIVKNIVKACGKLMN